MISRGSRRGPRRTPPKFSVARRGWYRLLLLSTGIVACNRPAPAVPFDTAFHLVRTVPLETPDPPISELYSLSLAGDTLLVVDAIGQRVLFYAPDGRLVRELPDPAILQRDTTAALPIPRRALVWSDRIALHDARGIQILSPDGTPLYQSSFIGFIHDVARRGDGIVAICQAWPAGPRSRAGARPDAGCVFDLQATRVDSFPLLSRQHRGSFDLMGIAVVGGTIIASSMDSNIVESYDPDSGRAHRFPVGASFYRAPDWAHMPDDPVALYEWKQNELWIDAPIAVDSTRFLLPFVTRGSTDQRQLQYVLTDLQGRESVITRPTPVRILLVHDGLVYAQDHRTRNGPVTLTVYSLLH